jgi:16S rRNA (guanine527-N7)-methyltransferase
VTSTIKNRMDDVRIAELLAPFLSDRPKPRAHERAASAQDAGVLSPVQLKTISIYIDMLLRWNARINLTAVRDPEEIVTRHFGESILAARHLCPESSGGTSALNLGPKSAGAHPHVIDVGSGAGFPGLPIKIWAPSVRLTLIESNQKKATFLREAIRGMGLTEADVFAGRTDSFAGPKGDVVTLRAVERFESSLPEAARLVGHAGRLAILIGVAQLTHVRKLLPGLQWTEPVTLPLSNNRVLIIGRHEPESLTSTVDVG